MILSRQGECNSKTGANRLSNFALAAVLIDDGVLFGVPRLDCPPSTLGRRGSPPAAAFPELRERERRVLGLIAQGLSNRAIAERKGVSGKTVANYVSTILNQLRVQDRAAAARLMKERLGPG